MKEKKITRRGKMIKKFSAAFKDVDLSIAGKKKLKTLEEVLNKL